MSNIYIQEPPTCGKVLLITTVGDIDIELWSKETPKACRNFVQLAMEGYYNGTIFHRIVKGFIAQGGDPTGTGTGGESIYGHPFKDEFHSRLRFCRRGLVAMANSGKDDNCSQFFFTFAACPELQNKHTIFGKVTGETIYNMIKLEEAITDANETPLYPQKIIRVEILNNPFLDIVPRCIPEKKEKKKKPDAPRGGVKNFKLLSFGEEAAEDEEESKELSLSLGGKGKSMHDVLNDPNLSSVPAVDQNCSSNDRDDLESSSEQRVISVDQVKEKLKRKFDSNEKEKLEKTSKEIDYESQENDFKKEETERKKRRLQEITKEIEALKKENRKNRKPEKKEIIETKNLSKEFEKKIEGNEVVEEYRNNLEKYRCLKNGIPKVGANRESMTLKLLAGFKEKLQTIKDKAEVEDPIQNENTTENKEDVEDNELWLAHKLNFEGNTPVLAKDANTKTDDWFDITDPRNPINKRRREQSKVKAKRSF